MFVDKNIQDIMNQDNDEANVEIIQRLLGEIKKERQVMRDEAHIIKGELSQAMYNEDLRYEGKNENCYANV